LNLNRRLNQPGRRLCHHRRVLEIKWVSSSFRLNRLRAFPNARRLPVRHCARRSDRSCGAESTRRAMDELVANNIVSWFSGKGPLTPVPEAPGKKK